MPIWFTIDSEAMIRSPFRWLPALLLALLAAAPAEAQQTRPIRRGEIVRAPAANLYDLLAAVRPEWLSAGGDTTDLSQARVLVLVGGVPAGTLAGLRTLGTEDVESVRLETPEEYQQRGQIEAYRTLPRGEVGQGRTVFGAVGVGFRL
jgi:hypothetical protein